MQAVRHGDVALVIIDKLPEGLMASKSKTLMTGSHGNNHDIRNGTFYPKQDGQYIFGYLKASKNCTLLHPDHFDKTDPENEKRPRKEAKLPAGFYELHAQFEHKHESMIQVVD